MRSVKDIDFTKVTGMTYAVDEYLKDLPIYELVSHYVSLYQVDSHMYEGEYFFHRIRVNISSNKCYIDSEEYNGEEIVIFFEGYEVDPNKRILQITGHNLDEYISDVTYNDGTMEYLDVKGKKYFLGGWRKKEND